MKSLYVVLILLCCPKGVYADEKKVADIISYGTVITQITLNTVYSWKQPERKKAIVIEATKIFFVIASSETIKRIIHEERPDRSDNLSFWSEHSALCAVNGGWSLKYGLTLDFATATGRVVAKKHHVWDTLAGIGVGLLFDKVIR